MEFYREERKAKGKGERGEEEEVGKEEEERKGLREREMQGVGDAIALVS